MSTVELDEGIGDLPNICGSQDIIAAATSKSGAVYLPESQIDFDRISSGFCIALHMHQPLIPAGGDDLRTAKVISNLKDMMDNPNNGDNHNAPIFHWCYRRMGEFIPQLVCEGKNPRIMLDYSGCLLYGLKQMDLHDAIESLRTITCDPRYRRCTEWVGSAWGHPVAPSTPVQDYRLHVRAWQHYFAAIFGLDALGRVKGFSPSEMALPNHPDICYEFLKTLKDCGYRWMLVQEHTVERIGGGRIRHPHLPHRLIAKNSSGETLSIIAIIKTQGSDTKLIGQMQPYYEAKGLSRTHLKGKSIPPVVTQVSDGENGGVMMNEFPQKYQHVSVEASTSDTPPVNISEYLEYLETVGLTEDDFAPIQPIMQNLIWDKFKDGAGAEAMEELIKDLKKQDSDFHVEGGSWTNNISWVHGYDHVLGPMEAASAAFAEKVLAKGIPTSDWRYRNALFHLLTTQTSCYRYWGEGRWTDFGRELCRRTMDIINYDF